MKHLTLRGALGGALLLFVGVGCQKTAEGIQQDTLSAKARAEESAGDAKQALDRQVGDFKTQAGAELQKLTQQVDTWKTEAQGNLADSKQKLEGQLHETRTKLDALTAHSQADWDKAKQDFNERMSTLGHQVHDNLEQAGDKIEKKLK
jgi:phage shock protein A